MPYLLPSDHDAGQACRDVAAVDPELGLGRAHESFVIWPDRAVPRPGETRCQFCQVLIVVLSLCEDWTCR
jgi:hypothetical protein